MNDIINEWIIKAEEDWRVASREFIIVEEPAYSAVCYHSQQCSEKYMKAFLISKSIRPDYTHDLIKLSSKIGEIFENWSIENEKLYFLNSGGVQYRYPGENADFDDAEYCLNI